MLNGCTQDTKKDILIEIGKDPAKVEVYREDMKSLVKEINAHQPKYKHLPLTEKADFDWFYIETYAVWDNNITKIEFMQNGLHRYPEYRESLEYLADYLTSEPL